jgi:crossover junction endodeoxyribonuclease RuvC
MLTFHARDRRLPLSIILGLDPGSRVTGFGVIKSAGFRGEKIQLVSYGVIRLDVTAAFPLRMKELSEGIQSLLIKYQPNDVVIEKIFLGKNADSAFKLGHARGVLMCEAAKFGAGVFEYATRVVKKSLTGTGGGNKDDVQLMVERLLGVHINTKSQTKQDATDALAMALHHAYQPPVQGVIKQNKIEVEL